MNNKELSKYLAERWKYDNKFAFICRLLRFGVIASNIPAMNRTIINSRKKTIEIMGSKMILNPTIPGVSRDLIYNKIREPNATEILRNKIKKGNVCLDIGANIGYYALQEAALVGEKGFVYAIEPVKKNIDQLKENIKINNYENIFTYQMAIGNKIGMAKINVSRVGNWSSINQYKNREYTSQEEVAMTTVDNFLIGKKIPNIIRMDVEGYEYEIIQGMKELLDSNVPLILAIEMHLDILREKSIEICKMLKRQGFRVSAATVEPHPVVTNDKYAQKIIRFIEKGIGASTGVLNIDIDDLIEQKKFSNGQVEYLEVFFERR